MYNGRRKSKTNIKTLTNDAVKELNVCFFVNLGVHDFCFCCCGLKQASVFYSFLYRAFSVVKTAVNFPQTVGYFSTQTNKLQGDNKFNILPFVCCKYFISSLNPDVFPSPNRPFLYSVEFNQTLPSIFSSIRPYG